MNRKFLYLVILTFLFVTVICSSVQSEVFAAKPRAPVTASNCVSVKPTKSGAVYAERCCDTTTFFNGAGQVTHSSTQCQTCQWAGGGTLIDCTSDYGAPPGSVTPIPKPGSESNVLPPSTSEQSNNTNPLEGKTLKHGEALKGGSEPNSGISTKSNDTLR